ncbi:MAG: V-type ATP synthase subunit A [Candidatus Anstonellales archaeon]
MKKGRIFKVSGPVVIAQDIDCSMYEIVLVGEEKLIGEVIKISGNKAVIQVYEDTTGLKPDEPVIATNEPLSVELGPGILKNIYDGIQRPLDVISEKAGVYIPRGIEVKKLKNKKYDVDIKIKKGSYVKQGQIIGEVDETEIIKHRVLSPYEGKVIEINKGPFDLDDVIALLDDKGIKKEIKLWHSWPVRKARPFLEKYPPTVQLLTGMRVIDTFFPIAKGGTAAIPGPFGSGKTVTQQSLAKFADADIVVYVGCGERGNEMTEVLKEFPELEDPKTKKPLMERTVLIANTSNMPVAAREASIYTGITIAEYYRDMGYDVALMADSTSRWAEALREISGRLEEMPGEEGYPAYLARKLAEFYERAGRVKTLSGKEGSITIIGAVSPPGGDLSEPVSQNTLRVVKVFLALDASLSQRRHFPSINWLRSYSLYKEPLNEFIVKNIGEEMPILRERAMEILQKEAELQEIVQLVGPDALPEKEQLILAVAKMIREDFLQQNAYHEIDKYCEPEKQLLMLNIIITFYKKGLEALNAGADIKTLLSSHLIEEIGRMKEKEVEEVKALFEKVKKF